MASPKENPNGTEPTLISVNPQERLRERSTIVRAEQIDLAADQPNQYLRLLRDPVNSVHFNPVPRDVGELIRELKAGGLHGVVGKNLLEESVGYCKLRDPQSGRNDTWVEGLVIENDLQNKGRESELHAGSQFLEEIIKYAFSTPTHDGRVRPKINAAVIKDIPNWERACGVFERSGFRNLGTFEEQVEVMGEMKDVEVFELKRSAWEESRSMLNREGK